MAEIQKKVKKFGRYEVIHYEEFSDASSYRLKRIVSETELVARSLTGEIVETILEQDIAGVRLANPLMLYFLNLNDCSVLVCPINPANPRDYNMALLEIIHKNKQKRQKSIKFLEELFR